MAKELTTEARVMQLEQQVKSLTETVNAMYDVFRLDKRGVPRVEVATISPDNPDPKQAVDQTVETPSQEALQRFLKPTAPSEPIGNLKDLEQYVYTALNPELSQIRVVALHTAKSADDPIQCSLYTIALDDIGVPRLEKAKSVLKYPLATLSYTWGDATDREFIVVDGKSLSVTKNLYNAMKHLRDSAKFNTVADKWRLFWWIDAICINQQDLDERKSQVGLMTRLYRSASVGHVWLGPEADDSTRAMGLVRKLGYSPKTMEERTAWNHKRKEGQTHQQMGPGLPPRMLDVEPAPISADERASNFNALIKLFGRPWFSRVWVRQEFALPDTVNFHCGHDDCTWQEMTKAAMILSLLADEWKINELRKDDFTITTTAPLVSCFRRIEELRQLRERLTSLRKFQTKGEKTFMTMRHVLFHARDSDATDLRDKVYSMLPLTNSNETNLTADYRISHLDVYKAAALDMARTSLNFLCACQYMPEDGDLPSWVPNLSRKWRSRPTIGYLEADGPYSRDFDFRYASPSYRYIPGSDILEAEGVIFDGISLICEAMSSDAPSLTDLDYLQDAWSKFYFENRDTSRSTEHSGQLPWKTLVPDLEIHSTISARYTNHKGNHDLYTIAASDIDFFPDPIGYDSSEVRVARNHLPEFHLPAIDNESTPDRVNRKKKCRSPNLIVGRKFVKTTDNAFGFVPLNAEVGDVVCHFKGSQATFILRKKSEETGHLLMGDACFVLDTKYIPNITKLPFQKISLV